LTNVHQEAGSGGMYPSCGLSAEVTITIPEANEDASSSKSSDAGLHSDAPAAEQEPGPQQKQQQPRQTLEDAATNDVDQQHMCRHVANSLDTTQQQLQQQQVSNSQSGDKQQTSPFQHQSMQHSSWTSSAAALTPAASKHAGSVWQQQTRQANPSITLSQLKSAVASGQAALLLESLVAQVS
jgi:hypothetical protein